MVDWVWHRPHAENAGCRSGDGDDMVGVRDSDMILCPRHWKVPLPLAGECEMGGGHSGRSVVVAERTAEHTHCGRCTDYYSTLSSGREVAGWPSLQWNRIRGCSERMAEHITCSPNSRCI